ncbi:MAG: hypothetical protein A2X94_04670 [Bdellovibrionales bacterium GWB1_55_8]|nr:MAG: hypothetical protein A2X94_04670 [Bdellovibrionales bacterium GWB1_55_8]
MRFWLKLLPALGFFAPLLTGAVSRQVICPELMIQGAKSISLSETERYLLCGDPGTEEPFQTAWKVVPRAQAEFFLRRFLENRGFYYPRFEVSASGGLLADPGPLTRLREIAISGAPEDLEFERRREVIGRPLTPELLDEIEQWITQRLQGIGYPCPQLETAADVESGRLSVSVQPGDFRTFGGILEESVPGIRDNTLRRFDAFRFSDPFNADYLRLTAERTMSEGTLLSTHFETICRPPDTHHSARQSTVPGLPHVLRFGFGANTEGLVLARASWQNTRLGQGASIFDVAAFASTKEQSINTSFSWFFNPRSPRYYLKPYFELRHRNEEPFETVSVRYQLAPGTTWDGRKQGLRIEAGPAWDLIKTLRGIGPQTSRFLSLETRTIFQSHYFEFHRASPRSGFYSEATLSLNDQNFLSDVTAQRLNWEGELLWNWRNYYPPLLIGGVRWDFRTTITQERLSGTSLLPSSFRHFLGGLADHRGFGRNELPDSDQGALSLAYLGFEVRLANQFPIALEPLFLLDVGMLGRSPVSLRPPLYWSPGAGVRWETPFGALRATLAHGYLTSDETISQRTRDRLSHWQFYFSFGEEF